MSRQDNDRVAETLAKLAVGGVLSVILGFVGQLVPVDWLSWPVAVVIGMITPWVCVWALMVITDMFDPS